MRPQPLLHGIHGFVATGVWLVLGTSGCAKQRPCADGGQCLSLMVEGTIPNTPTRVELLDAAGHRLGRYRTTTDQPEQLIEVRAEGFALSEVACVRVRSGDARGRTLVQQPIAAANPLSGDTQTLALKSVTLGAPSPTFDVKRYALANLGMDVTARSVAIGVLPQSNSVAVYLGVQTSPATADGAIHFLQYQNVAPYLTPVSMQAKLSLTDLPPYPLATARVPNGERLLAVGRSPLVVTLPMTPQAAWPWLFRSNGSTYASTPTKIYDAIDRSINNERSVYIAFANLDNNSPPDLLITTAGAQMTKSSLVLGIGRSDGGFETAQYLDATPADALSAVVPVRQNPDGTVMLAASLRNAVQLLSYDPGTRQVSQSELLASSQNLEPLGLAAGDFNGDEQADLAATINVEGGSFGNKLRLWLAGADGRLQATSSSDLPTLGKRPRVAVAADLNGDQIDDIVTADFGDTADNTARLSLIIGRETPTASGDMLSMAGVQASQLIDVAVGDLNGDCKLDLVAVSQKDPYVYVLINTTP